MGLFTGSSGRTEQLNRFNPQQMQQQAGIGQLGYQGLQNTNLEFDPIRQKIMRQFETQTIPGLLERLQGFQGAGTQNSSALGGQIGGALQNLGGDLAAQESQYNLSKFQNLLGAFQQGQQSPWDTIQHAAQPGLLHYLAGGAGQALGQSMLGGGNPLSALLSMFSGGGKTQSSTGSPVSNMQGSTMPNAPANTFNPTYNPMSQRSLYSATSAFPNYGNPGNYGFPGGMRNTF